MMSGHSRLADILVKLLCVSIPHVVSFAIVPSTGSLRISCFPRFGGSDAAATSVLPSLKSLPGCQIFNRPQSRLGSSPSEYPREDEIDIVQREAEELEQMIRRSRGVVMEAIEREWREAMELTLEKQGGRLCAEAYKGFEARGRGCVFVSVFISNLELIVEVLMLPPASRGNYVTYFVPSINV